MTDPPILANPRSERVRAVAALARRSVRERHGLFLAEGPQAVREAVRHRPALVRDLYATPEASGRHTEILASAARAGVAVHACSPEVLAAMADTESPQGLLAVVRIAPASLDEILATHPRLLVVLAHVRDPGNAGTVLRAADAAGADAVVFTEASVDPFGPKVVRSTAGSLFHLPVVTGMPVGPLLDRLRAAGIRRLAADGTGPVLLDDADLTGPHAWVFGNEAWGLPPEVLDQCDRAIAVPIYGAAESLNLSTAAAVCLYASARAQRREGGLPPDSVSMVAHPQR